MKKHVDGHTHCHLLGQGHVVIVVFLQLHCRFTVLLLSFGWQGRGIRTWKRINGCTHCHLSQRGAHCCCCLSPPSLYGCNDVDGRRREGNGDCAGGGSNQLRCWLCSLFLLDSRGGEAGRRRASAVSPIIVSCNGGHVAVIVSYRCCCTVATTRMAEGGSCYVIGSTVTYLGYLPMIPMSPQCDTFQLIPVSF
jgi:hypothetical protein